ncbi:Chorismate mutase [Penicillium cf. griseofulvum]|uniref:Chorismate mutase n=1 Tax=Penicillium cf. griseofulvum TaxID=2972120 RepID=A0A9W9JL53_9EURO|nr:Chorismate mutase [Penicillium cf. griseofulvum]KAJ5443223.1 Chorismate mutase [Penicillium cf. griseofulvum]KAJ5451323.1 Chorismate mutase [Penicillium cf. griseofulvum]
MLFLLFGFLTLPAIAGSAANANTNTDACYGSNVILEPSADHRPVPWGAPSVHYSLNGTLITCCDSLDEIRTALDDIDDEILDLLNRRAAYVREATRFKSTRASVNVPSRNAAVLKQAEQQAVHIGVPVTIALAAMGAILNSSVPFEQCIFDAYNQSHG